MLYWRHSVIVTPGLTAWVGLGWMVFNMQLVVIIVILFIHTRKRGKAQRVARKRDSAFLTYLQTGYATVK